MRSAPGQWSFSSGETSPLLFGRPDYQRYQNGARVMRGFLPLRQGGATRAPGTLYRGATKTNSYARLVGFEFASNDSAILEFTDQLMRVWRYGALVGGETPFELATPFTEAMLDDMQFQQSADVIYITTGGAMPIQQLRRFALDNWTVGPVTFKRGPFMPLNTDASISIQSDNRAGAVTLTATGGDVFENDHIGGLFRLIEEDTDVPEWTGNTTVAPLDLMRFNGRTYRVVTGIDTGVNPPSHATGTKVTDKTNGIKWEYLSDGEGVVEIETVVSATEATGVVRRRLPDGVVDIGTSFWAEGAWSAKNGYPKSIELFDQRLFAAATTSAPRRVWASTLGDFRSMEPGDEADDAFAYDITGEVSQNGVQWMKTSGRSLVLGALGEEHTAQSSTTSESIGIQNARFRPASKIGSIARRPIAPDGNVIFIAKDKRRVFEVEYSLAEERHRALERSLPAEHIGATGFEEIIFQSAPLRMVWIRMSNGELAAMVNDPAEEVLGWSVIPTAGGFIESLAVTPSADGSRDILTAVIKRTIGGSVVRYIEEFAPTFAVEGIAAPASDAVHLYASITASPAEASKTFDGLDHLEGESVHAWTAEGVASPVTVSGGQADLEHSASKAVIGLFDESAKLATHNAQPFTQEGSSIGRRRKIHGVGAQIHRTVAIKGRSFEYEKGLPLRPDALFEDIVQGDVLSGFDERSGIFDIPLSAAHADEVTFEIVPVGGAPATVLSLTPIVDTSGG